MEFRKLAFLSVFILFSSCAYYDEKTTPDVSTISAGNVNWDRMSNEFFQPRCAICHGNGEDGVNVSSYAGVIASLSRIKQDVITRKKMPPDSPLTTYESTLISTWVNAGAPQ